jgi:hypothetical protein
LPAFALPFATDAALNGRVKQRRQVAWMRVVVWLGGCGGGGDGNEQADAAASVVDAAPPDALYCPVVDPGAGDGFPACNPISQEGCADGEKCT